MATRTLPPQPPLPHDRPARRPMRSGDSNQQDPFDVIDGLAPNMGQDALPHVVTFQGILRNVARTYYVSDEALKDSWENARFMRNDPGIMECLEQRQRSTALLGWHLEAEDETEPTQKMLVQELTGLLGLIPNFLKYRECLLHALWYGKYAVQHRYRWRSVNRRMRVVLERWKPVNGDKLVFRYDDGTGEYDDDQVGIRVGAGYTAGSQLQGRWNIERFGKIAPTDHGLAYFLEPWERPLLAIHKHMIEDAEYEDPARAGAIHGVGIRNRLYWFWYQKQEALAWMVEYLERSAFGMELWSYPAGNPKAKADTMTAAQERIGNGRNIVLVPRHPDSDILSTDVKRIEPGMAGVDALDRIIREYFGWQIKRYILGQILTSETASTGLGSGVASIHLDTYLQIIRYDAINLGESLTTDLVKPLLRYNWPQYADMPIKLVIETEAPDVEGKLGAWERAYKMGLKLRSRDVAELIGAAVAQPDEETLSDPQHRQAAMEEQQMRQQAAAGQAGGYPGQPPNGNGGPGGFGGNGDGGNGDGGGGPQGGGGLEAAVRKMIKDRYGKPRDGVDRYTYDATGKLVNVEKYRATPKKSGNGDHTAGWKTVGGGANVFIGEDGQIMAGCPGLKGEDVDELGEDEEEGNRDRREHRQDVAEHRGIEGDEVTHGQVDDLEEHPHPETGKDAEGQQKAAPTIQRVKLAGREYEVKHDGGQWFYRVNEAAGWTAASDEAGAMIEEQVGAPEGSPAATPQEGTDTKQWQAGDVMEIPAAGGMMAMKLKVFPADDKGLVGIGFEDSDRPQTRMTPETLKHVHNDLRGVVDVPPNSGDALVDAVSSGKAKFLGKGDDGMAFEVGEAIVKVSTPVPFQPLNPGYRSPEEAQERMEKQVATSEHLRAAGVPGMLPTRTVKHGDKVFAIRQKLDIPEHFTAQQLDQVRETIRQMHAAGYSLNDQVQVGVSAHGDVYHYDTGKAEQLPPAAGMARRDRLRDDMSNVGRLFSANGEDFLPWGETARETVDGFAATMDFYNKLPDRETTRMVIDEAKKAAWGLAKDDAEEGKRAMATINDTLGKSNRPLMEAGQGRPTAQRDPLFQRTGEQFANIQRALGFKRPAMGPKGAARIQKTLAKHPAGPVIQALLGVEGPDYDRNGFAQRGGDVFRQAVDAKFSQEQLDAASEWLQSTYSGSQPLANVNQERWLRGAVQTATATVPPEPPPESRRSSINARTNVGKALLQTAKDWNVAPDDLGDALDYVWEQRTSKDARERRGALQAARKLTGLNSSDVKRLKNAGYDHTSAGRVGGLVGQRLAHFDEFAQEIAREHPVLGLGNPDDQSTDFGAALWDVLDEDRAKAIPMHDPGLLREAAEMVLANRQHDEANVLTSSYEEFQKRGEVEKYRKWKSLRYGLESPTERAAAVERAARETDCHPSEAEKEAGNYRKGKCRIYGLEIAVENPKGSIRRGRNKRTREEWSIEMAYHYGYIKCTESEADGDHIDVFLGPDLSSELVFVVDQVRPGSGRFDEHKAMLGWKNEEAAKRAYNKSYEPGWAGLESITPMTIPAFRAWLQDGDTGKRIAGQAEHYAKKSAAGQMAFDWKEELHPRGQAGKFAPKGTVKPPPKQPAPKQHAPEPDEPFSLSAKPAPTAPTFEPAAKERQTKMFRGMNLLAGQMDLFDADNPPPEEAPRLDPKAVTDPLPGKIGDVYRVAIGEDQRYAVRGKLENGLGDAIFKTEVEAIAQSKIELAHAADRERSATRESEKAAAAAKAKAEREDIDDFAADAPALTRARIVSSLNRQVRHHGKVVTRKDLVRSKISEGWAVQSHATGRRLAAPDGRFLKESDITKIGMDYAAHLEAARTKTRATGRAMTANQKRRIKGLAVDKLTAEGYKVYASDSGTAVIIVSGGDLKALASRLHNAVRHGNDLFVTLGKRNRAALGIYQATGERITGRRSTLAEQFSKAFELHGFPSLEHYKRKSKPAKGQKTFTWNEDDHPRDAEGQFAEKPEAGKPPAEKPRGESDASGEEESGYRDYVESMEAAGITPRSLEDWLETKRAAQERREGKDKKPEDEPPAKPPPEPAGEAPAEPAGEPPEAKPEDMTPDNGPNETPRDEAGQLFEKAVESDYAFARKSTVPNAGEDVLGSARHKANAWRGLEDAERDGTAEALVTRQKLLKNEPPNLSVAVDRNPLTALVMHYAMRSFPAKPGYGRKRVLSPQEAKKNRAQYLDAYQRIKAKAEELALSQNDPVKALRSLSPEIHGIIREYRGAKADDTISTSGATDRYNATANGLVSLLNTTTGRGNASAGGRAGQFAKAFSEKYPDISPEDKREKLAEHVADILEGASLNKTLGLESGKAKPFTPADLYVKTAERKGGPDLPTGSAKAAIGYMTDTQKFRGIQFGNSMTDEEREHHTRKCADAMADLADILGIPEEYASWKGRLGIAFGARGRANASAHYEPSQQVINLTRKSGTGALAHEWGHFADHVLGGADLEGMMDASTGKAAGASYMSEDGGISYEWSKEGGSKKIDKTHDPLWKAFDGVRKAQESSGFETRLLKSVRQAQRDGMLSGKKAKYFNSGRERFARCFERYVQRKLETAGRENTYLAGMMPQEHAAAGMEFWPTDEEVDAMTPAFDSIFEELRGGIEKGRYWLREERGRVVLERSPRVSLGEMFAREFQQHGFPLGTVEVRHPERYSGQWDESKHPRGHQGNPGQFRAKGDSATDKSTTKGETMAQPLPAEWIAKYRATWRDAGFVTPDGTLVGQEGRHREMLAELGSDNRPGYEGDAARVAAKYGLVRVTSFHAELAVQLWAMPTADQIAIIAAKAETKPRFSLEVSDSSGESLDWRAWDDRKPGPAAIRSFVANAQRRVRAKDGAAVAKRDSDGRNKIVWPRAMGATGDPVYRGLRSDSLRDARWSWWAADQDYAEEYGDEVIKGRLPADAAILDVTDVIDYDGYIHGQRLEQKLPGLADAMGIDDETEVEADQLWDSAGDDLSPLADLLDRNGYDGMRWIEQDRRVAYMLLS